MSILKDSTTSYLTIGSYGFSVSLLSEILHLLGFSNDKSGLFDRETAELVKQYQASRKLKVDGIVGANTWRSLIKDVKLKDLSFVKSCIISPGILTTKVFSGATIWNKWGGLIDRLADILDIDKEVLLAVIQIESSGVPHGDTGLPTIRFEVHQFWRRWGVKNPITFKNHFRYGVDDAGTPLPSGEAWKGHYFRKNGTSEGWRKMHTTISGENGQKLEWEVFNFASKLATDSFKPAVESTSFGLGQIMGFNALTAGYSDLNEFVSDMSDERYQIIAMIQYIKSDERMLNALKSKNFIDFAGFYNGPGQMTWYGNKILEAYKLFKSANLL